MLYVCCMITIAIDGPSGVGKSTVAKQVGERLGLEYLDSGGMYRAVAWVSSELGLEPGVVAKKLEMSAGLTMIVKGFPEIQGMDISKQIRLASVSQRASKIALDLEVRKYLVAKQQEILARGGFVSDGRDVTTVLAPQAEVKVFLDASATERAARRAKQTGQSREEVIKDQAQRDARDKNRTVDPLMVAPDAHYLDSTNLSQEEVVELICKWAKEAG